MARGKIQIKKIENSTNRQVTYSKRRNGLFKKASELTVLCDAKVSIIMVSCTDKLHEYISPSITTKQFFDQYQKASGIDLWNSHYEKMQEELRQLKDVNKKLRTNIRQRLGDCLEHLGFEELLDLEKESQEAVYVIRERKDIRGEDPQFGMIEDAGEYETIYGYPPHPRILTLRLQPNLPDNLHAAAASDLTTYSLLG
ncbi:floral homeotic protein DEFICIENS-like protein [Tanacetum coccineum]